MLPCHGRKAGTVVPIWQHVFWWGLLHEGFGRRQETDQSPVPTALFGPALAPQSSVAIDDLDRGLEHSKGLAIQVEMQTMDLH